MGIFQEILWDFFGDWSQSRILLNTWAVELEGCQFSSRNYICIYHIYIYHIYIYISYIYIIYIYIIYVYIDIYHICIYIYKLHLYSITYNNILNIYIHIYVHTYYCCASQLFLPPSVRYANVLVIWCWMCHMIPFFVGQILSCFMAQFQSLSSCDIPYLPSCSLNQVFFGDTIVSMFMTWRSQ